MKKMKFFVNLSKVSFFSLVRFNEKKCFFLLTLSDNALSSKLIQFNVVRCFLGVGFRKMTKREISC